MKITVVGMRPSEYTNKQGQFRKGLNLYYSAPQNPNGGGKGQCVGDVWINAGTPLYDRFINMDYSKPFAADMIQTVYPGSRYPSLEDVKPL